MNANRCAVSLTGLVAITSLWGADFWEEKDFTEWDEKEIIRIMTQSPWARRVELRMQGPGSSRGDYANRGPELHTNRDGNSSLRAPGSGAGVFQDRGIPVPRDMDSPRGGTYRTGGPRPPALDGWVLELTVRWYALPLRNALDRWDELRPDGEDRRRRGRRPFYLLGISGLPPELFRGDPDRLKKLSELIAKESFLKVKGQEPIAASGTFMPVQGARVFDVRSRPWRPGVEIFVMFPRGQEGSHVISLEDKKVEFVTQIITLKLKRKFKLKEMIYQGKLEL